MRKIATESLEDTFTSAKLSFFSLTASEIEPFLVKYQTNRPMVHFLYYDLTSIYRKLQELIVKRSLLSDVKTSYGLMQIDLSDSKSLLKISDVQFGFFEVREVQRLRKCDEMTLDSFKVFQKWMQIVCYYCVE